MTTGPIDYLGQAEQLLAEAETDPSQARPAAMSALTALLTIWGVAPRGNSVVALLEQAAETDDSLLHFLAEASILDQLPDAEPRPAAAEQAKVFVAAARTRLANV